MKLRYAISNGQCPIQLNMSESRIPAALLIRMAAWAMLLAPICAFRTERKHQPIIHAPIRQQCLPLAKMLSSGRKHMAQDEALEGIMLFLGPWQRRAFLAI
jgi:hypothetical protein